MAVGILAWLGTTSADPTNAANWQTHSGTPAAGIPSVGDGVLIDQRAAGPMTGAATACALETFVVTDGSSVNIDVSGWTVNNSGSSYLQYNGQGTCRFAGSCSIITIEDAPAGAIGFEYVSGTCADVRIFGGKWQVDAAAIVSTTMRVLGGIGTMQYNATGITTLHLLGGELNLYRAATTANLYGSPSPGSRFCHLINRQAVSTSSPTATFTTLNNYGALIDNLSNGVWTNYNGYAGAVRNTMNPWTGYTITNSILYQPTHYMQDSWGATGAVTYTNPSTKVGAAGPNPSFGVGLPTV